MKVTVSVAGRSYLVEIADLYARPIIAVVNGERIEVWPQVEPAPRAAPRAAPAPAPPVAAPTVREVLQGPTQVHAPLPGVIAAINVHAGTDVAAGEQLCVLEAMKMKNSIHAPRAGRVTAVRITVGQHVTHGEVLFEYAD